MLGEDGLGVTDTHRFKVCRHTEVKSKNQSVSINNSMTDLLTSLYYKY